jgi:DNA-binding CsgD family transcriptional regulator
MRLQAGDEAVAHELARGLRTFEDDARPALAWLTGELRQLLGADRVLAYSVAPGASGYRMEFAYGSGFPIPVAEVLREGLAERRTPWALFDPAAPEPAQRNVVVDVPLPHLLGHEGYFRRLGLPTDHARLARRMQRLNENFLRRMRMNDMNVCRTLVCDGPSLLAWVGAARPEPFGWRERSLLRRLVFPLVGRLRTERLIGNARLHASAFTVALDAIAAPALLLDDGGGIAHANAAGRAFLARHALDLGAFDLTPIKAAGMAPHQLAILRGAGEMLSRLTVAEARWSLTTREAEVLAPIVRGESNRAIATALGLTLRTIELHVTRLLEKAGVANRAALISHFFANL